MGGVLARTVPERRAPRVEARGLLLKLGERAHGRHVTSSDDLSGGVRRIADGGLEIEIERTDHGTAATLDLALANRGDAPVYVESIVVGLRWCGHGEASHRFLRHGWQSWSETGYRDLDDAGPPAFPSGPWLRGMYHCVGVQREERSGWHESETLALIGSAGGGPSCLVGVLETGRAFGVVYVRAEAPAQGSPERPVEVDVELRVETTLEPGEGRRLEAVRIAVGADANTLLERFATLWGRLGGARTTAPYQTGWCSWYHYFHRVTEDDVMRNLDALVAARDEIPVEVVQLDDGYQRTIGDWLHTNDDFPGGLARVAGAIRGAGFVPGLWTAPFAASAESEVLRAHSDWALRDQDGWLRGSLNAQWSADGWVYALDPSHPEVARHLEETFAALVSAGFPYHKLDFLYMAAMQGRAADPTLTRAERLRAGLDAIRRGAGDDAFLLGCGCPMGPAVGVVDAMRIGPDVAPSWGVDPKTVIPGLEPMLPSTESALRSIQARLFMHRRLWQNDPDCVMVRTRETALSPNEARTLATAVALSGGLMVVSDDLTGLEATERELVAEVVRTGREVDRATPGACRVVDPLSPGPVRRLEAAVRGDVYRAALNLGDAAAAVPSEPGQSDRLGAERIRAFDGDRAGPGTGRLAPHASRAYVDRGQRPLAVFCDFDGTFSVRDVGSTLAQQHLGDRRQALWRRYEAGEVDAWQYAERLFDGFEYGEEALEAFLRTIELDAGAGPLVDWCAARKVPLQILSDGFDHNLDRLQAIHGVCFEFLANRLQFEDGRWRIAPGGRNPACDCGTGTCKRGIIESYRAANPAHCVVHVGNGRVSDRCGAEAAHLVFAKETLASDLDARGVAYVPFETLLDVIAELDLGWGGDSDASSAARAGRAAGG